MTAGEIVFKILSADATVTSIAGTRVFPNVMPEGTVLPAVVYQTVSQVPQNSFTNTTDATLMQCRMQVDCYARKYLDAQSLAAAVFGVLGSLSTSSASALLESQRDLYDNEMQLHRVSMDFSIWK